MTERQVGWPVTSARRREMKNVYASFLEAQRFADDHGLQHVPYRCEVCGMEHLQGAKS